MAATRLLAEAVTSRISFLRSSFCSALMRTIITETIDSSAKVSSGTSTHPMA